jgi:hypothetical protein
MDYTLSPNMQLLVPIIGVATGPSYAQDLNSSLLLVDQHDHTSGKGSPILPGAININSDLTFANNSATNLKSTSFYAQSSNPGNAALWVSGVDLFYTDGNGTQIQLTTSGAISGTPGTISGLVSPASASFSGADFVWKQTASLYANMQVQSIKFHNTSNSNIVTLSSVTNPSGSYGLVLPTLPATPKILSIDSAGNIGSSFDVDNSTLEVSSNTIRVKDLGITAAKIANNTITTNQISASAAILGSQITTNPSFTGSVTASGGFTATTGGFSDGGSNNSLLYNLTVNNNFYGGRIMDLAGRHAGIAKDPSVQLYMLRGEIASNGTISVGEGFSASYLGTGQYRIVFTNAFSAQPVVVASFLNQSYSGGDVQIYYKTSGEFRIYTRDANGTPADSGFSFIVMGT